MLWRFARYEGLDVLAGTEAFEAMPDAASVSPYAREAMAWCNENGVITGNKAWTPARIDPQGNATRAQTAKIFTVATRDVLG